VSHPAARAPHLQPTEKRRHPPLHQHRGRPQPLSRGQLNQCAARASSKMRRDDPDLSEITKPLASGHRHACERDTGQRATPARP